MADHERAVNVRDLDILGTFVGLRLADVTQHDDDEFRETGAYVCLHFDDGRTVTFPVDDKGFDVELPE